VKRLIHILNPINWRLGVWAAISLLGVIMSSYAWIVSSPTGSSPDDDFHQISIWCPTPVDESCVTSTDSEGYITVLVPQTVAYDSACYAFQPDISAACTEQYSDDVEVPANRFDNGQYPGGYYDAMHLFVEHDVDRTILVLRWINAGLAALIYGTIFLLASPSGRRLVVYTLLGTSVPLVTYFSTSINPTAWGILGVVSAWLALHCGIVSISRSRRIALFAVGMVGATIAAAARADASSYLIVVACAILAFHWTTIIHRLRFLIPVALVAIVGVIGFASGGQNAAMSGGMTGKIHQGDPLRVLAYNLFQMPEYISSFWNVSMGWLDTQVPMSTAIPSAAVSIGLCCYGVSRTKISFWQGLSLIGTGVAIIAVPIAILQASLSYYPSGIQVRYIAPLIIVFVGICLADRNEPSAPLPLAATICFFLFVVIANIYALYTQIQRYASGLTGMKRLNLMLDVQWWRSGGPSPLGTWILGSFGFALMSTILFTVRQHSFGDLTLTGTNGSESISNATQLKTGTETE